MAVFNKRISPTKLVLLGATLLAFGCSSPDKNLTFLDSSDENESASTAEERRLQEMQLVRYVDANGVEGFMPASLYGDHLAAQACTETIPNYAGTGHCTTPACVSLAEHVAFWVANLCEARMLQAAATTLRAQPMKLSTASRFDPSPTFFNPTVDNPLHYTNIQGEFTVPPQSAATRAAILRRAALFPFNHQASIAFGSELATSLPNSSGDGKTLGEFYTQLWLDYRRLFDEVTNDYLELVLAVSDAQRSDSASASQAAARSVAGAQLSRAEAAHFLVGGAPGLLGSTEKSFCFAPDLSGRTQAALGVLRKSGVDPQDVANTALSITRFLNDSVTALPSGSIAARMGFIDGKEISSIEAYTGLSVDDFVQARSYLAQEQAAFARSRSALVTPILAGGVSPPAGVKWYAASSVHPTPPPREYYGALAKFGGGGGSENFILGIETRSSASNASSWINRAAPAGVSAALYKRMIAPFYAYLAERQPLRQVVYFQGTLTLSGGFRATDKVRVVKGLEGFLCATTGKLEGEPCPLSTLTAQTLMSFATNEGSDAVRATVAMTSETQPRFVVKPRDPLNETPGAFDLIGSFPGTVEFPDSWSFILDVQLEARAGAILQPSETWCTRPRIECDGVQFDERLPLENELAEDNDGVESSWKHYLSLARQAAAEADALGEQYITTGVELDRMLESSELRDADNRQRFMSRAESELETVQETCGVAIDTADLLPLVGGDLTNIQPVTTTCSNATLAANCCGGRTPCPYTCSAPTNGTCQVKSCQRDAECCTGASCAYQCVASRCIQTPIALAATQTQSEALTRIKECLGQESLVDYVALGDAPLCVWEDSANSSIVCGGASAEFPCPNAPVNPGTGVVTCDGLPKPPNTVWKPVDKRLNLFQSTSIIAPLDPCSTIRMLRSRTLDSTTRTRMAANLTTHPPLFGYENLTRARSLGWTAFPGTAGASAITKDGWVKFSTALSTPSVWPCNTDYPFSQTCTGGLFCSRVNCGGTTAGDQRLVATMNQRWLAAIVMLKRLTWGDYEKILVPSKLLTTDFSALAASMSSLGAFDVGPIIVDSYREATLTRFFRFRDDAADATPGVFWRFAPTNATLPLVSYTAPAVNATDAYIVKALQPAAPPTDQRVVETWQKLMNTLTSPLHASHPITYVTPLASPLYEGATSAESQKDAVYKNYFVPAQTNDAEAVYDAAELLCETTRGNPWYYHSVSCPEFNPATVVDFSNVKEYAQCRVRMMNRQVGGLVLARVPSRAIEKLREFSVDGSTSSVGGQIGSQILRLKAGLGRYGDLAASMHEAGNQLNDAVDDIDLALKQVGIRSQQEAAALAIGNLRTAQAQVKLDQIDFQKQAAWIKMAADCAGGILGGIAGAVQSGGASLASGAASCGTGAVSAALEVESLEYERRIASIEKEIIGINNQSNELQVQWTQLDSARQLVEARARVRSLLKGMSDIAGDAQASLNEIRASIAEIETLRLRGQRAVSRATQFQSVQAATTENIEASLSARLNVSKRRYMEAHQNAIKLTFLAKRAIEQRLGVRLSELRSDLPLVEAPSSWESKICTAEGVDYDAVRTKQLEQGLESTVVTAYADAFIGDYVRKLENVVESYRLENDFQEGVDEAIVSVRDDVWNVRRSCAVPTGNLLKFAGQLDQLTLDSATAPGWEMNSCTTVGPTCLAVKEVTPNPFADNAGLDTGAAGYTLAWGTASTAATSLRQKLRLDAARYRLSWYTKEDAMGRREVDAVLLSDAGAAFTVAASGRVAPTGSGWPRHYVLIDVPADQNVIVDLVKGASTTTGVRAVAAVMLESIGDVGIADPYQEMSMPLDPAKAVPPGAFISTEADNKRMLPVCEDTDGAVFRSVAWEQKCQRLCTDGFSDNCPESSTALRCFWETRFSMDQRDIEAGRILAQSGFARGNFNYRIEEVGVNFVGTNVRDCQGSNLPSTCFAAGFLPFSIQHLGPYTVRNHAGADFEVKLFTGNIEHARGLSLERYLTNPLSSTDRELLGPYVRGELQGRPLDGNFVIRIWDEEGVNFNAIADVQLYLKYRYWTRFN